MSWWSYLAGTGPDELAQHCRASLSIGVETGPLIGFKKGHLVFDPYTVEQAPPRECALAAAPAVGG